MLLRKHPFSFLRPLFLYRSYKSKEPPLRVALLVFSPHGDPGKSKRFAGQMPIPRGEAGPVPPGALKAQPFQERQCPCRKRIIATAPGGATSGAVGGLSDGR